MGEKQLKSKQPTLGKVIVKKHKDGYWMFEQEGARKLERKQCNSESAEQKTAWGWLKWQFPEVADVTWHTPNESDANAFYGAQQKQMGKKGGVSDLVTLWGDGGAFELKRVNPALYRPSKAQREFLINVAEQGKFACVAWGAEALKYALLFYLQDEWK